MKALLFFSMLITGIPINGQIDSILYEINSTIQWDINLNGNLRTVEWESKYFKESRKITIYEPFGFHKDSVYNLIVLTDNQSKSVASLLENSIKNSIIEPVLIVGIHNREPQPIDTILKGHIIDFRSKEMLDANYWLTEKL